MLKPAQLYERQLEEENIKSWYKPENIYWHGGTGEYKLNVPDNTGERHCFVSVDKDDNILGYISYAVDWGAMSAYQFGIISYKRGSIEFVRDLYTAICNIFEVYNMNRMEWSCYADNPAIRGYRNFIKKFGGRECAYYRMVTKLQDGKLHDSVIFELMGYEFRAARSKQLEREFQRGEIK